MLYHAKDGGVIEYVWNNINPSKTINYKEIDIGLLTSRVDRVKSEKMFWHLANLDNAIFNATVDYFRWIGSLWTNLPLTTLMISSPWEVYAWQKLDYTTDTLPVEIPDWFGNNKRIFLSESSQFYLELALLIKDAQSVFSIYNSFRKERSDATHLSEFQHIEFEWKVNAEKNIEIFVWLYSYIVNYLIKNNSQDLLYFVSESQLKKKLDLTASWPLRMPFSEALSILYKHTGDSKYKEFSLKHFGTWEEVKLTELLWANVIVEKFPMLQIPFYHAIAEEEHEWVPLAKNADFILHGFRETIWAGERIKDKKVLLKKAEIFNLPENDYLPYLQTRDFDDYVTTSGFGMWWQRLLQWITNQPYIYEATVFPRTHLTPNP